MYSSVENTALHLVKETDQYYISIDSWESWAYKYKQLKYDIELQYNIPVIHDEKTVSFLNTHAWHDWVAKNLKSNNSDIIETIELLNRLFPDKKKVFFYELHSIIASFCQGNFVSYDNKGNIEQPDEYDIKRRRTFNYKYYGQYDENRVEFPAKVKELENNFFKVAETENEEMKNSAYLKYREASDKFLIENHDLTPILKTIGENNIVCPYIFTDCCVEGSEYENAGDIYMVVTDSTVYFEEKRHF